MEYFQSHTLKKQANSNEYELILHLNDYLFEFAEELGDKKTVRKDIMTYAQEVIQRYPNIKITAVKIMIGGVVMSSLSLGGGKAMAAETAVQQTHVSLYHQVAAGETLWSLSRKYNTTVDLIKKANQLSTDMLQIGQKLIIPKAIHTVEAGDTLYALSRKYGTTVDAIKEANQLASNTLTIGRSLVIPVTTTSAVVPAPTPTVTPTPAPVTTTAPATNTITYTSHTVQAGDTLWGLSVKYGIPQSELLKANGLTTSSVLSIGQKLTIPVHHIAVKPTVSAKHGELLNWWSEAQYVFAIGETAKVTDVQTGKSFMIKRTIGANHADSETLTVTDSNIAKSIWGGYSWKARAIIVEVDGRKLAASMSFFPHEREFIADNGITGHFDVYFSESTRHVDGKADPYHQTQVEIAAGIR